MKTRFVLALTLVTSAAALLADEGMWRADQLPFDRIAKDYGVKLAPPDVDRLQAGAVRLVAGGSGGTGTFASPDGLILTNHHVALDCIRTSSLADRGETAAQNLIEQGFTARTRDDELPCRGFRAQIERSARDVTAELAAAEKPGMAIADIQRVRQLARSDLERACQTEKGDNFTCAVVDFNSGARSFLIVYEEYKDIRLAYAPEKQLGYFGGDEMNFRFPRYVSDISILRAYQAKDGGHRTYDRQHVPVKPDQYRHVSASAVKDGEFTLVAGFPGNTNRYRESYSAEYNIGKGMPERIRDYETELALLRKYAAMDEASQVALQSRVFGLANTHKYEQDVFAALNASDIVTTWRAREREFRAFLGTKPALEAEYGDVLSAQAAVYKNDVEANADLDAALGWIQRSSIVSYGTGLYQFAVERAKTSDREREPQFQERRWPDVREALLEDEPIIDGLEEDLLAIGFDKALKIPAAQAIPAVRQLVEQTAKGAAPDPRQLARAVLRGTKVGRAADRKTMIDLSPDALAATADPALAFARALEPTLAAQRQRGRVLNEKLLRNRARFARGLVAWKGSAMSYDANFTLRITYGRAAGYVTDAGVRVPFATRLEDMFALAEARGNKGDFALPPRLLAWRRSIADAAFRSKYADMIVNFVSTNDITGGNSGSSTLNRNLEIVGLIFDGNKEAMASDWIYNDKAGRALSTDIHFALTVAREVHGAGWIVDELMAAGTAPVPAGR